MGSRFWPSGALLLLFLASADGVAQGPRNASPSPSAKGRKNVIVVTDAGWNTSTETTDCVTGWGNDTWSLVLAEARKVTIAVSDLACPGDYYEVYLDGVKIGTTPVPSAWGCDQTGTVSSGSFTATICAGTHEIKVRDAGFDGHSQEQIAAENMCPASFTVSGSVDTSQAAAVCGFSIAHPQQGENFLLDQQDLTATGPITFATQGATGTVNWTARLTYATSGGKGQAATSRSFETEGDASDEETFVEMGGRVAVRAAAGAEQATPVKFTITAAQQVPESEVTNQLVALYQGATSRLMTGLAARESSYQQFRTLTLYGVTALWPNESRKDQGSHIGLMMVDVTTGLANAWSWKANTSYGVSFFGGKVATARRVMQRIIKKHPGLPDLNPVQLENMALVLYGPYASADDNAQYYLPVHAGAAWTWATNNKGNALGVGYANSVRKMMK